MKKTYLVFVECHLPSDTGGSGDTFTRRQMLEATDSEAADAKALEAVKAWYGSEFPFYLARTTFTIKASRAL
jgi:hypothetical protein